MSNRPTQLALLNVANMVGGKRGGGGEGEGHVLRLLRTVFPQSGSTKPHAITFVQRILALPIQNSFTLGMRGYTSSCVQLHTATWTNKSEIRNSE
jgi:hypothetical protein